MSWKLALRAAAALAMIAAIGCSETGLPSPGDGGGGAACPSGPVALLNLHIHAHAGPVPPDTTVAVSWSAGPEPTFALDDKSTWRSLLDGNVICDVDASAPAPKDLTELVCHLWTSGATHVEVRASGYVPYAETLKATMSEACKGPIPTDVSIELSPASDAGTG